MLDLDRIDLQDLCVALEDHSPDARWRFDPRKGEVVLSEGLLESEGDPDAREQILDELNDSDLVPIEPVLPGEGYGDLEDFVALVRDPKARDLLERAIAGRGAFRRFKDTLLDFPELREAWFRFHDTRMERRAIEWLASERLIDESQADAAIRAREDPSLPELSGAFDPSAIAEAVAADLRNLYGDRLRRVALFGSWARGDAHPESDIDLLVVLDRVGPGWEEQRRMEDVMWRHSLDNDTVVSALVVSEGEFEAPAYPALINAKAEARAVA